MGLFSRRRRWRTKTRQVQSESDLVRSAGRRLIVVRLVVVLLFAVLALQLLRFQVWNGGRYQLASENNRLRIVATTPSRGLIYDREHNPLVRNVATYTAVVIPADIAKGGEQDLYYQLSQVIDVPPDVIQQKVQDSLKRADPFTPVPIKEQLDERTVLTLAELRHTLPGVGVRYDAVRDYSDSVLLSHIFGYVGRINEDEYATLKDRGYQLNDVIGKAGIEYVYEDQLRGTPGRRQVEVDPTGRELQTLQEDAAKPGNNIVLSIDLNLQQHITDILQQSLLETHSPSGVAIMMDVHTGEILAYVSLPNYDVNLFSGPVSDKDFKALLDNPGKPLVDHAIADEYPPGSTFKVITASGALQEGVATTSTTITVPASRAFSVTGNLNDNSTIVYDWAALGTLDFYHGVAMSSDIYFYCLSGGCPLLPGGGVGKGLGPDRLVKYAKDFGLGQRTGIDLPDETTGLLGTPAWKAQTQKDPRGNPLDWVVADTYFEGIGQGYVTATPIQMVRVAAALANGGDVLRPHVIREIDDANGNVVQAPERDVIRHVSVSQANLDAVKQGMIMAVEGGSAQTAWLPPYRIAGKTGTAEFGNSSVPVGDAVNQNGVYTEHGWFISYAPFDNPQVALVVFHELGGGAATAAPTAKKIWNYYFNYYKAGNPNPEKATPTPAAGAAGR